MIQELAQTLPNDRQGFAFLWKNKNIQLNDKPKNLFIHKNIDRQDLIGFSRTRVVLCHCTDTEFLESAFHGTPMICFPRQLDEQKNAIRAQQLEFGYIGEYNTATEKIVNVVKEIHESNNYRENARVVSRAIRDRSNHAMDRLQFWMDYTARHYNEGKNLLLPRKVSMYNETVFGFIIGFIFAVFISFLFFMSTQLNEVGKTKVKFDLKKKHRR